MGVGDTRWGGGESAYTCTCLRDSGSFLLLMVWETNPTALRSYSCICVQGGHGTIILSTSDQIWISCMQESALSALLSLLLTTKFN